MEIVKIGCPPISRGVKVIEIPKLFNPVKHAFEEQDISISITGQFNLRGNKTALHERTLGCGTHSFLPLGYRSISEKRATLALSLYWSGKLQLQTIGQ